MRSDIADHLFIPQSHTSNMCVCGEPNTAHVSVPTPVAPSFHMETSIGGIPVTLCACGLLMYQPMATVHMAKCESYRKTLRTETFTAPTLEYAAPVECDCQCARCGSSCGWIDCSDCLHGVITTEDDEGFDVVEHCLTCGGCGGWWCCLSSAEWCAANPVPGREHVARGSVEWFDVPADTSTNPDQGGAS